MSEVLFEPCQIGSLEIKNRFLRSATWDATADITGRVTGASVEIYRGLGEGNIGLIISGYAFVSAHGQAIHGQYGAHNDDMIPSLSRLAQTVHEGGGKIALQIVHAGINSVYLPQEGSTVLAVSEMPGVKRSHRQMTDEDIEGIIDDFVAAAVRAKEAGFDAVQLHGAHGYLMSQFISPLYNQRTDRWGGSPENRSRFHTEVVRRVRQAVGRDFPFFIKFGVMDDREGGLSLDEGIEAAKQMVAAGIDAIEVSGGVGQGAYRNQEGELVITPFRKRAAAVKQSVTVPVALVGGVRSLEKARDIVASGDTDMVSMCRPFIREPELVARWQRGETAPAACITCNKCMALVRRGEPLECGDIKASSD